MLFCVKISHKVVVKMSAGSVVICKFHWGCRICFQDGSLIRYWMDASLPCHMDHSLGLLECPHDIVVKFSSVAQLCLTLCNPMNRSMPDLPVHHQLLEFTQTHVHWLGWWCHPAISSSVVPLSSCPQSLPASGSFPMSQLLHEVAKVLEFQLQHQSFLWTPRTDLI